MCLYVCMHVCMYVCMFACMHTSRTRNAFAVLRTPHIVQADTYADNRLMHNNAFWHEPELVPAIDAAIVRSSRYVLHTSCKPTLMPAIDACMVRSLRYVLHAMGADIPAIAADIMLSPRYVFHTCK